MESRSSGSVRIFWLDRPKILGCLVRAAEALAQLKPEIQQVWLFGSLARGDATPGSDADVLLIVDGSPKPFHDRAADYALDGCGIGVDLLVYTRDEFEQLRTQSPRFYRAVMDERLPLHQRAG